MTGIVISFQERVWLKTTHHAKYIQECWACKMMSKIMVPVYPKKVARVKCPRCHAPQGLELNHHRVASLSAWDGSSAVLAKW